METKSWRAMACEEREEASSAWLRKIKETLPMAITKVNAEAAKVAVNMKRFSERLASDTNFGMTNVPPALTLCNEAPIPDILADCAETGYSTKANKSIEKIDSLVPLTLLHYFAGKLKKKLNARRLKYPFNLA